MKTQDSSDFPGQTGVDKESDKSNSDQTWGRTDNEAYIWEKEGHQEHHDNVDSVPDDSRKKDSTLEADIANILKSDNFMDASNISIEVAKGEVKLSGSVLEENDKQRAEDLARAVPGVVNVENEIWVGPADSKPSSEHHYKGLIHKQSASPKSIF